MATAAEKYDFKFVDEYLHAWDRFANGENRLVPYLRDNKKSFENHLTTALVAKDKKAPSRAVFYAVVQVGGFIETDSSLGQAVAV